MDHHQIVKILKEQDTEFLEKNADQVKSLSQKEIQMLNHMIYDMDYGLYGYHNDEYPVKIPKLPIKLMSDFVRSNWGKLVSLVIPSDLIDDFYYIIDKMNQFQYSHSFNRRSFRTADYLPHIDYVMHLMLTYYRYGVCGYGKEDMNKYLRNDLDEDAVSIKQHCIRGGFADMGFSYMIAARIDKGDTAIIDTVKEMMTSENNNVLLGTNVLRSVFMSSNTELHNLVCKLLIAARLSEGLRQAICETADFGTAEGFIKILHTIKDENLIRFSSVKRAVGTWTGLCPYEDPDRLASKMLDDMLYTLDSRDHAIAYINTTDPVHIYMGLWSIGFYEILDTKDIMLKAAGISSEKQSVLSKLFGKKSDDTVEITGNKIQLLTMGYFCLNGEQDVLSEQIALAVIDSYPDDLQFFALFQNFYVFNSRTYYSNTESKFRKSAQSDKKLLERHYEIMLHLFHTIPKKEVTYSPLLFPWFSASVSKGCILGCMTNIAVKLKDNDKKDFICGYITDVDADMRENVFSKLLETAETEIQRSTLIKCIADKESYTRQKAFKLIQKKSLRDDEYEIIENYAKYKKEDLRNNVIQILKSRSDEGLAQSIERMLKNKDENIRLAALDMLQYGLKERDKTLFENAKTAAANIENPTDRERILMNEVANAGIAVEINAENGYGLYDTKVPYPSYQIEKSEEELLDKIQKYFSVTEKEIDEMLAALLKIIDDNENLQYTDQSGEERLLGNLSGGYAYRTWTPERCERNIPFTELWDQFYEDTVKTPQRLTALYYSLLNSNSYKFNAITENGQKRCKANERKLYGDAAEYFFKDDRFNHYRFKNAVQGIVSYLELQHEITVPYDVLIAVFEYILAYFREEDLWYQAKQTNTYLRNDDMNFFDTTITSSLYHQLDRHIIDHFEKVFLLCFHLSLKCSCMTHDSRFDYYLNSPNISAVYYIKAYQLGIMTKDMLLKSLFEMFDFKMLIRMINPFFSGKAAHICIDDFRNVLKMENKELSEENDIPTDSEIFRTGLAVSSEIMDQIMDVELKRGDSETVFSNAIMNIEKIYGMDRLIDILKAMGSGSIGKHTYYYYRNNVPKTVSLSHMLAVCYPAPSDNAEKLAQYLKDTNISNDRLIEVAMYSPQWIDIIEDYLKIDGLKSGCYYFMAHTAEYIDAKRQAIIAKYTPLSQEELNGGCFDVQWFYEAYDVLGDKNFHKLYKSAKHISASNMHTRARKFADAALGKFDIAEIEQTINEKRNKDLLLSLAVIPSKDRSDILQRYEFIQKFLKESKQFGAQRRASEAKTVEYAMKNLAVTAGYSDETRLTLSMETQLVKNNTHMFEWNKIGDYDVKIAISDSGKAALQFEKNGKALKSAPAAIKKNEDFLEIKEFCTKLKNQYSRTVSMFEKAMEESEIYTFAELKMLCENPVTKSIVENLVFVSAEGDFIHGMISDGELVDFNGETAQIEDRFALRTAHPYDLYIHQIWHSYQQLFFDRNKDSGTKQPFRQVFRELYVKLPEEREKDRSLMFAGNQIQTKRTVGALRNRRWVADYEDGLQKIYYKDNVIASIYAVADWFSPSDIEAPTLEGVIFEDRRTYQRMKIGDIPDIIYSEVMRDVDLAVSVAHAGGVDPETGHSTIEMRKVILEFNLQLFHIKNVTFDKNHALIDGKLGKYSIHLGSGVIHQMGGKQINVVTVSSGKKSKIFLPFIDEDPKSAEIMTKVLMFAEDKKIKDPFILEQLT